MDSARFDPYRESRSVSPMTEKHHQTHKKWLNPYWKLGGDKAHESDEAARVSILCHLPSYFSFAIVTGYHVLWFGKTSRGLKKNINLFTCHYLDDYQLTKGNYDLLRKDTGVAWIDIKPINPQPIYQWNFKSRQKVALIQTPEMKQALLECMAENVQGLKKQNQQLKEQRKEMNQKMKKYELEYGGWLLCQYTTTLMNELQGGGNKMKKFTQKFKFMPPRFWKTIIYIHNNRDFGGKTLIIHEKKVSIPKDENNNNINTNKDNAIGQTKFYLHYTTKKKDGHCPSSFIEYLFGDPNHGLVATGVNEIQYSLFNCDITYTTLHGEFTLNADVQWRMASNLPWQNTL